VRLTSYLLTHLFTYTGLLPRSRITGLPAIRRHMLPMLGISLGLTIHGSGIAQATGVLYEPEPPANAAYVRIVHLSPQEQIDVLVDGNIRQSGLRQGQFGDYMILNSGQHELQLRSRLSSKKITATRLEIRAAQVLTLGFGNLQTSLVPQIFEDKTGQNRMKANLTVYHLADKLGPVNISTADGKTSVFRALTPSGSQTLAANPIKVELLACPAASQPAGTGNCSSPDTQQAKAALVLERGDNYSLLLSTDANSALQARVSKNTLESRAGK